ncbi:hypothetical protein TNCT_629291 [Trichonephila clavata]|uniref:Uncharacterized protein n=1 Tax=Trichonephila clavata TaxID=2740835 RepID=A0A8X6L8V2_TRICU|nr:hypothetical protein TNCT_629291 [Trichonephila clavata]
MSLIPRRVSFQLRSQEDASKILIKPANAAQVIGNLSFSAISQCEADPLEMKAPSHCLTDTKMAVQLNHLLGVIEFQMLNRRCLWSNGIR